MEYFAGFKNTAHNDWITLALFYGVMKYVSNTTHYPITIPNTQLTPLSGLWVIFPAYMSITFGSDIFAALEAATKSEAKKDN